MKQRLPAALNQWNVEFDPYGFANSADWLKRAEKTEDILQLVHVYSDGPIIDVGFYPETFRSVVIKNEDWANPIEVFESTSEADMENWVYSAIERYANGL